MDGTKVGGEIELIPIIHTIQTSPRRFCRWRICGFVDVRHRDSLNSSGSYDHSYGVFSRRFDSDGTPASQAELTGQLPMKTSSWPMVSSASMSILVPASIP